MSDSDNGGLLGMFSGNTDLFECLSISKLEEASSETKICVGIAIIILLIGLIIGYLVVTGTLDLSNPIESVQKLITGGSSPIIHNDDDSDVDGKAEILLFYANWCDHCKKVKPVWESLTNNLNNTVVGNKLIEMEAKDGDIEENMALIEEYNITGYPTIVGIVNGEVKIMEDNPTEQSIIEFIKSLSN
tara:strand:- start:286 stop:849 length:564 start_codon:yes stop_codon:yes gene_type:complete